MTDELKTIADKMASAILVANPGPHVFWGLDELKVYFGCESTKLGEYMRADDFPPPAVNESQRLRRWSPQDVIKWYKRYVQRSGRPRAA